MPRRPYRLNVTILERRETPALLTVNSLSDDVIPNGELTLREAVAAVNAGSPLGLSTAERAQISGPLGESDAIQFLGRIQHDNIFVRSELVLSQSVTIRGGNGVELFRPYDAATEYRLVSVGPNATVTLERLIFSNGRADVGGGIRNGGDLTLSSCRVTNNKASISGGGISNDGRLSILNSTLEFNHTFGGTGGGIANSGDLLVVNSAIYHNQADGDGGAIHTSGTAKFVNLTIESNVADHDGDGAGTGAAIFIANPTDAATTIGNSLFFANTLTWHGQPNDVEGPFVGSHNLFGPDPQFRVIATDFVTWNSLHPGPFSPARDAGSAAFLVPGVTTDPIGFARVSGAAVDIGAYESPDVTGPLLVSDGRDLVDGDYTEGNLTLREALLIADYRTGADTITFRPGQLVTLTRGELSIGDTETLTIQGNPGVRIARAAGPDEARFRLIHLGNAGQYTLADLILSDGHDKEGGAIRHTSGTLTLRNCVVSNNTADENGGAIRNESILIVDRSRFVANRAGLSGGAISNSHSLAELTVTGSTFRANVAADGNGGAIDNTALARVTGSLFHENRAEASGSGGAISNYQGTFALSNSTVSGNFSSFSGGGIVNFGDGQFDGLNLTVAKNDYGNVGQSAGTSLATFSGPVTVRNSYLEGTTYGTFTGSNNLITTATVVGPLADNGGPTWTHLPIPGSPLVDAGDSTALPVTLSTDQRGEPRVAGASVDIGAVEFQPGLNLPSEFTVSEGTGGNYVRYVRYDGTVRYGIRPYPDFTGGVRSATADFTGDGIADIVVATGPGRATNVIVRDGETFETLFTLDPFEASFTGGLFVAAGDVTGDGIADLAICPDEGGGPRVRLFDGKTFVQIADFYGIEDPNFRGGARPAIGDMNGDGRADLVVAAGFGGGPRVAAFNGRTLGPDGGPKLFDDFFAFEQTLRNGIFLAVGDVNGDGYADLVTGGGPGGGPRVQILDGNQLVLSNAQSQFAIANFFAGNSDDRDGVRVAVKDLNGDRHADIVTASGRILIDVRTYPGRPLALGTDPYPFTYFTQDYTNVPVFVG